MADPGAQVAVLLQVLPCGVLIEDEHGRTLYCNEILRTQFGIDAGSARPHAEIGAQTVDPVAFDTRVQELLASSETRTEDVVMADGRVFERDHLPVVEGGAGRGRVWTYWDFTDRKRAEQARERGLRAEILAQRVGVRAHQARADEAERDRVQLEESSAVRERLMATASHELRTPLTSISSFAELLADDVTGDASEFVQAIRRNAQRMLTLVDDLLLLARIRNGVEHVEHDEVPLDVVVREVAHDLAVQNGVDDRIDLDAVQQVRVRGGRSALVQVVSNLVENALKYSDDRVAVRLDRRDRAALLRVEDHGVGIAEEDLERVFDQFFRTAAARGSARPGSGLGLAVTRALVEQMQGEITLTSTPRLGTAVVVRLPLA
ncbi:sensor histidine kinase [Amnibacterium kyonggiense]